MDEGLEKLHGVLVEILDFVYSVCEEHGLLCFLVYGTALGAYRHHGFIPWDDDMDVAMPREDYTKFLQIMKQEGHDKYEIQDEDNEDFYFLSFAKVRKKARYLWRGSQGMCIRIKGSLLTCSLWIM